MSAKLDGDLSDLGEQRLGGYRTGTMFDAISLAGRRLSLIAALLAATVAGCPRPSERPAADSTEVRQPLTLLVVDDPLLGAAIAREWRSRTEEELKVHDVTAAEIAQAARLPGDVIVFPGGLLGELVEGTLIVPLAEETLNQADYDRRDIFDQIRLRELVWGNRTLAVPLGSPRLLLVFRRDVFESLGIEPPANWSEYQRVLERLADREVLGDLAPAEEERWHAALEPLAGDWAAHTLLARAAAYAMHRDQVSVLFHSTNMEPLIDQPPYVRALGELVAAAKAGGYADDAMTPAQAFDALRAGHAAMALTWPPPHPADESRREWAVEDEQLGFALLPGAPTAYSFATKAWEARNTTDHPRVSLLVASGRMAAVTATTPDVQRAHALLVWLSSREASNSVGLSSPVTTLFRTSQIPDAGRWTGLEPDAARRYAEVLAETMVLPRAHPGVRLPGRAEYLNALSRAVQRAASDEQPPQQALKEAAEDWRRITERLGIERQRRASSRSLGQESL